MIHAIIEILIGFVLWKFLPGKITAAKPKVRHYIDLAFQIIGILMMILGGVTIVKQILSIF